jgi:hypothetical protein
MATYSYSSRMRHDSDAAFREWGSAFSAALAGVGLVKTADTGQINWGTVTRAGTNSDAGYEVWRFSDPLQDTYPIVIRFDYGTGSGATSPRLRAVITQATDGAGNATGTYNTTPRALVRGAAATSDNAYTSYFSFTPAGLCIAFNASGTSIPSGLRFLFLVLRKPELDQTFTSPVRAYLNAPGTTGVDEGSRYFVNAAITGAVVDTTGAGLALGHRPLALASGSLTGSADVAVFPYWGWSDVDGLYPMLAVCNAIGGDVGGVGATFSTTLFGSTPHTYLNTGAYDLTNGTGGSTCIIWE